MVNVDRLRQMFPPEGVKMKCKPTLLCAACYQEEPHHRIEWQFKDKRGCDRHNLRFLAKCINCGTAFLIPSQWEIGECQHCGLQFEKMAKHQPKFK